jgi:hypothetical protein
MKQMLSLAQLAATIKDQAETRADYILPVNRLEMTDEAKLRLVNVQGADQSLPATKIGHNQLAEYAGIPSAYYQRLLEQDPKLLARNVNRWVRDGAKSDDRRMVRTMGGSFRALLSERYQRIDNDSVAEVALNVLSDIPGLRVVSTAVTESRLYIKATSNKIVAPDPGVRRVGSLIEAGIMISNSEVGMGAVSIKPFANFLYCLNGMVRDGSQMRAQHVGRKIDADLEGMLSDSTKRLEDEVVLRKVRDVIKGAFESAKFQQFIDKLADTTKQKIEGDVHAAVEALGPVMGLNVGERQSVLRHLIEGGDLSRYGLANAITRTGEDVGDYDRATELETLGFRLIDLSKGQWDGIANAKPLALAA